MKENFNLYLQSRPAREEARLIKELMIHSMKANVPFDFGKTKSFSLLSFDESHKSLRDTQLDFYAKAIENMKELAESKLINDVNSASHP